MFLLLLIGTALGAASPKVAVLPCDTLPKASVVDARRLDAGLREELGERVDLIPLSDTEKELKKRGIKKTLKCDDHCLAEIGSALGADRVVKQTLSFQPKEQAKGGVWIWTVHQVDVKTKEPHGHFERAWVYSATTWWELIMRLQAKKLATYDPETRLTLKNPPRAEPTEGPVDEPGMVYVPEGEFIMGSELGELDEEPRHIVYLDAFYIDKYEVTNEAYNTCVDAGKCTSVRVQARHFLEPKNPAVAMGWDNAVAYCEFVGKRLPTEAEWEKAARGTDERRYPWGDEWNPAWVNMHHDEDGYTFTSPVGAFPENVSPYGAYDMAGNAWEWTQDWASDDYYANSPRNNPKGPESGERRVMRGGSWNYDVPFFVSTHNRSPGRPFIAKKYVGFRCAKDAPSKNQ